MKQLHYEMTQLNLAGRKNVAMLGDLLKKYCRAMLHERKHYDPYKRRMPMTDWELIHLVKKTIDDNLDTGFSTKELAAIVNSYESKLKKLYPMITGSSIEEYRKYKLCVRAQINIMRHYHEPIKSFQPASGYSNMPNFSRACLVRCCCKPSQLRSKEWDLKGLSHELIVAE
jgi:AraC-like DNA-binding protein